MTQAAYQLIAEGGFERLRTRDIAARADVNIATLHYYFARKEDLISHLLYDPSRNEPDCDRAMTEGDSAA